MAAGDNEKKFQKLISNKFGNSCLSGKQTFEIELVDYKKVTISVDESIFIGDKSIFIEVDSGNMAKVLAGQYALLNGMYDGDKSNVLFLVIHYYRDNTTGKLYSPDRTLKNLNAIQYFNRGGSWISFNAFNVNDLEYILNKSPTLEDFINKVWPNE